MSDDSAQRIAEELEREAKRASDATLGDIQAEMLAHAREVISVLGWPSAADAPQWLASVLMTVGSAAVTQAVAAEREACDARWRDVITGLMSIETDRRAAMGKAFSAAINSDSGVPANGTALLAAMSFRQ